MAYTYYLWASETLFFVSDILLLGFVKNATGRSLMWKSLGLSKNYPQCSMAGYVTQMHSLRMKINRLKKRVVRRYDNHFMIKVDSGAYMEDSPFISLLLRRLQWPRELTTCSRQHSKKKQTRMNNQRNLSLSIGYGDGVSITQCQLTWWDYSYFWQVTCF